TGYPDGSASFVVIITQVGLVGGFLGSVAARTLLSRHPIGVFDVLQSAGVLLFGLGSLLSFVHDSPAAVLGVGSAVLLGGVIVSAMALSPVLRRGPDANLFFYTITGVALVVAGTSIGIPGSAALIFAILGTIAALAALARRDWMILLAAIGYLYAAAIG